MGQDPREIRQDIEETRERMGDTVEALGHKTDVTGRAKDAISDRVGSVKERVSGVGSTVSESTPDGGDVKRGARKAVGMAQENPLGLALGSVAVGFVAGLLIPSTRVEDEKLGPMADQVKDKAKETGQEAVVRGKEVAHQAAGSAKETVQQAGREQAEGQGQRPAEGAGDSGPSRHHELRKARRPALNGPAGRSTPDAEKLARPGRVIASDRRGSQRATGGLRTYRRRHGDDGSRR